MNVGNGIEIHGGVVISSEYPAARPLTVNATGSNTAIQVMSPSGRGILALAPTAIQGTTDSGFGVVGDATADGTGVLGNSTNGYGIAGRSDTATSGFYQSSTATNAAATVQAQQNGTSPARLYVGTNAAGVDTFSVGPDGTIAGRTLLLTTTPPARLTRITTDYTVAATDEVIVADVSGGKISAWLPPAAAGTQPYRFMVVGTGGAALTLVPSGAETINGVSDLTLTTPYDHALVVSDGINGWLRF